MALKATITKDEFGELDEGIQAHYAAAGDGYRLDVTKVGGWGLDNVEGLKADLSRARNRAEEAEGKHARATERLKSFEDDEGNLLDVDSARSAMKAVAEGRAGSDQWEEEKRRLRDSHTRELADRDAKIAERDERLRMGELQTKFREVVAGDEEKGWTKGDPDLLWPHVKDAVRWHKLDDGREVLRIAGDGENRYRYSNEPGRASEPMDLAELVHKDLRNRFPSAFDSSGAAGSGATPDETGGAGAPSQNGIPDGFELIEG